MRAPSSSSAAGGSLRPALWIGIAAAAALLIVFFGSAAQGQTTQIDAKQAELERVRAEIDATMQDVAEAQNLYNQAQQDLRVVNADIRLNRQGLALTERELSKAQDKLSERAAGSYKSGGIMVLDVLLSVRSFGDLTRKSEFVTRVISEDRDALQQMREIRERLASQREQLKEKRTQQAQLARQMRQNKAAIEQRLEGQRTMLNSLDAEVKRLIQEEQARKAREAAARRAAEEAQRRAEEEAKRQAAAREEARQQAEEQERLEAEAAAAEHRAQEAAAGEQERLEAEAEAARQQAEEQAALGGQVAEAAQSAAGDQYEAGGDQTADESQYAGDSASSGVMAADPRSQAILDNPNITMYSGVEQDIAAGGVDSRVLDVIEFSAQNHTITLSAIATGHPYGDSPTLDPLGYSGYPNAHYFQRAVDISVVDGSPVSPGNAAAQSLAGEIYNAFQPEELGSPWTFGPGSFSDALHQDHIHVGWAYDSSGGL